MTDNPQIGCLTPRCAQPRLSPLRTMCGFYQIYVVPNDIVDARTMAHGVEYARSYACASVYVSCL